MFDSSPRLPYWPKQRQTSRTKHVTHIPISHVSLIGNTCFHHSIFPPAPFSTLFSVAKLKNIKLEKWKNLWRFQILLGHSWREIPVAHSLRRAKWRNKNTFFKMLTLSTHTSYPTHCWSFKVFSLIVKDRISVSTCQLEFSSYFFLSPEIELSTNMTCFN